MNYFCASVVASWSPVLGVATCTKARAGQADGRVRSMSPRHDAALLPGPVNPCVLVVDKECTDITCN